MPKPVSAFLEVSLWSREDAKRLDDAVIAIATSPRGMIQVDNQRLVLLRPTMLPKEGGKAYVSPRAARLLAESGAAFWISNEPIALMDLPHGLTVVVGENADRSEYERWHP